eukprot:jgi/Galph1/5185/GphlegSOOS_G3821.1
MKPIVFDCGSCTCKVGFAGEDYPRTIFQTLVGHTSRLHSNKQTGVILAGNQLTQTEKLFITVRNPIQDGMVQDWDAMQQLFDYTFFNELCIDPREHSILLTELPFVPLKTREKMVELLFEQYQFPAVYIANHALLALYTSTRFTGVVVDIGDSATSIVPVYEGYLLQDAMQQQQLAGKSLENYLSKLLLKKGIRLKVDCNDAMQFARNIKESCSYVALDYERELELYKLGKVKSKCLQFPDGKEYVVDTECFQCPELLFHPLLAGKQLLGLVDLLWEGIQECPLNIHKILCENIVLSGGSMMIPGMKERLYKDLMEKIPRNIRLGISQLPDTRLSTWLGGSIVASLPSFEMLCMTFDEYREAGAKLIHERCF